MLTVPEKDRGYAKRKKRLKDRKNNNKNKIK